MSRVSVLVAAFNTQDFIGQCLDSLLTQTWTDIQIICVDDASTDNTPAILDKVAHKDNRLIVRHLQDNVGQAKARNIALQLADGDYVCMLDSDDWLSSDALEQAVKVFDSHPSTDCVLFQVRQVYPDHERLYPMPPFTVMTGKEAFEASLTWAIHGLYMVRTAIHKRYPFDDSSHAYSDDNTTRMHYLHSREVRQCDGVYFYRQHPSSVTHQISVRRFDYLRANESMLRQMRDEGVDSDNLALYEKVRWLNLIDTYMFYFNHRHALSEDDCKYGLAEMKRVWKGIDTQQLPKKLKWKPGYMPLRPFWPLFRLQEEIYFFLRKCVCGR